ncbi:MAG: translation initiation factor IF-2 [Candidatus Latescibacterota bacterium]|nr:translation initiation factor IF-2 [Candidatus Latescibacterota bacterium]
MANKAKKTSADKAKKKRIYEVAREFNLSSVAMVGVIRDLGFEAKNHMAVCNDDMISKVKGKFEEERTAARKEIKRKAEQQKQRGQDSVKPAKKKAKPPVSAATANIQVVEIPKETRPSRKPAQSGARNRRGAAPATPGGGPSSGAQPAPLPTGSGPGEQRGGRKRRRRKGKAAVDQREVAESVRRTMAQMSSAPSRRRRRRGRDDADVGEDEIAELTIKVNEFTTVGELATLMDVRPAELITACLQMGTLVTINQRLDMDTIELVADEFSYKVEKLEEVAEEIIEELDEEVDEAKLRPRPPVVTIMGHVDHGKTSLLDYVRRTNVVAGEAGGITQHIGAYHVELGNDRMITFLDTPGHAAFTAMRARGAQVTDVVVLIVAADDAVMPQTLEAIDHAKAAKVPLFIAINKVDLPTASVDKIKRELSERDVLVEDYGGQVQSCEISAITGHNVDTLLEMLALETELLELKADPDRRAKGTVVESRLDRGRGNVATVLVQEGTLKVGDPFITGLYNGRVRAMLDERGKVVASAGPSVPVQVLGLDGLPQAGDTFHVLENERQTREISQKRQQLRREQDFHKVRRVSLTDIHDQIAAGQVQDLRLIIKGDVDGSVEALQDALLQISNDEVQLNVIHRAVGAITETDVLLATASDAIIIGFNVRPDGRAREVAAAEHVDIRMYRVIYEAVEDVKAALSGLLKPRVDERVLGAAEVRETFSVPRIGTIAGCHVSEGQITRASKVRLLRNGVIVYEGVIGSLRRFKDDVRDVQAGFECGIGVENYTDFKVGDVIEAYETFEVARSLE